MSKTPQAGTNGAKAHINIHFKYKTVSWANDKQFFGEYIQNEIR